MKYLSETRTFRYRARHLFRLPGEIPIPSNGFGVRSAERSTVAAARYYTRGTPSPVSPKVADYKARPSSIIAAESLRVAIKKLADSGDVVAVAVYDALAFRRCHVRDLFGNHFALRAGESLVSYCPKGRDQGINDDGTWRREGRQTIKPGKWASKIIKKRFPDHEVATFASRLVAEFSGFNFEVSQDFDRAYDSDNYTDSGDFTSCMTDEPVGEFYRRVGAQVITVERGGKLYGRAIVWEGVGIGGQKVTLMDRTYTVSTVAHESLISEAESRGWWHKAAQTNTSNVFTDGTTEARGASLYIGEDAEDLGDVSFFPYLDTLAWQHGTKLTTSEGGHDAEYRGTDGTRESREGQVQDVDGDWIDEDSAFYVDGDYYRNDDDRITYCEQSGEYVLTSETYTVETPHGTFTIHERYVTSN